MINSTQLIACSFNKSVALVDQTLGFSDVQIILDRTDPLWIYIFPIWVACPRESYFTRLSTPEVRARPRWLRCLPWAVLKFSLLAAERQAYFRTFILTSVAGIFSLFPLLFTPGGIQIQSTILGDIFYLRRITESVIKVVYSVLWITFVYGTLSRRVYE